MLYLIMDYMDLGSVGGSKHLQALKMSPKANFSEETLRKYFRSCLKALDYLHNVAQVIHLDIKPDNILIDREDNIRLSDFGISKVIENKDDLLVKVGGTKFFMAPETWKGNQSGLIL